MPPSITVAGNLVAVEVAGRKHGLAQAELDKRVPLEYIMEAVRTRLGRTGSMANRVLVIRSSTGSGKSTMIPPELFHEFYESVDRRGIVCTQPRALTAADIPNQIVPYHDEAALRASGKSGRTPLVLGQNIGYQTGPNTLRAVRGINFVTTQVLLRQLGSMSDEDFRAKYAFCIVDEAHERSLPLDMLLWSMRRFLQRNIDRRDCPMFIVMSATFDAAAMADYLLSGIAARYENIIQVRGAVYDKVDEYLAGDCVDIPGAVRERLVAIVAGGAADLEPLNGFRDILIFVPDGSLDREFVVMIDALNAEHPAFVPPVRHVYLDSRAVASRNEDYRAIYTPYSELKVVVRGKSVAASRRVIVATNVAETGLTLESLRYMIDTGLYKCNEFNPVLGCNVLMDRPVTRGMWTQRFGRVGRKAPGFGWALFSRETRDAMQEDAHPSIVTEAIASDMLGVLCELADPAGATRGGELRKVLGDTEFWLGVRRQKIDLLGLDLLTLPPVDSLQYALDRMLLLGAIDCNCVPTRLGFVYNSMDKISLENAAMILAAYAWGAQPQELVTIASLQERGCEALPEWSDASQAVRDLAGGDTFIDLLLTYEEYMASYKNVAVRGKRDGGDDEISVVGAADVIGSALKHGGARAPPDREAVFRQLARENEYRDNYMACLARIGFNPFANYGAGIRTPRLDTESTIAYIRRLKMCIYEGYKPNLAEWNGYVYVVLRSGIQIASPHCGRFVVFGPILQMRGEYTASHICPLDGYVAVDKNFTLR